MIRVKSPVVLGPYLAGMALALMLVPGCSKPRMEDLHLEENPTGFVLDVNTTKARKVFPDREVIREYAWTTFGEDHNSISVTKYAGPATMEEIEAARDAQEERYGRAAMTYGDLEAIIIDGRTAWGWLETQTYRGELASLEYKAVVSYDDVCYSVEFYAGREDYRDEAKLEEVISRFRLGRERVNVVPIGVGAAFLLGGVLAFASTRRKR